MTPADGAQLDQLCIDTLRTLAIDAVQKANSGHPGTPMGAAPTAYCLWQRFLRYDPDGPDWPARDRFVLSVGHASALLYGLLYLCGVKAPHVAPVSAHAAPSSGSGSARQPASAAGEIPQLAQPTGLAVSMGDLQSFRQAGSRCSGHPEHGLTAGVETTTGPLGQGAANSVGMAIAQRWLAATYDRPGHKLFDYRVYALCGDGDMMEGISSEAASLAGHLRLSNLCWIYDDNHISIEGSTAITFSEDVGARFEAYRWRVVRVADGAAMWGCWVAIVSLAVEGWGDLEGTTTSILPDHGAPRRRTTMRAAASSGAPTIGQLTARGCGQRPRSLPGRPRRRTTHHRSTSTRRHDPRELPCPPRSRS